MKLLRGKRIASGILADIKVKIKKQGLKPALAVVLVGENKASRLYIKLKARAAKKVGISFYLFKFKSNAREKEVIKLVKKLNKDKKVSGIVIQLPLPLPLKHHAQKIINTISPRKDADGFSAKGGSAFGGHPLQPVFPTAIMKLLESAHTDLKNKRAIILANSEIFGKIMKEALKRQKISSQIILKPDLGRKINLLENADIIITAVGKPKLIKGSMIKKGSIIIDGGITKKGRKTLGDVDFNSATRLAGYLSPVPGGVGPVTVACLLENVYRLAGKK